MKFYKLVKSIDYVTYPSLIELRKISASIGDAVSNFKNIILTALIAAILELTTISSWLVKKIASIYPNGILVRFSQTADAGKAFAIFCGLAIYIIICICHWIRKRWGSNKNTVDERNQLASVFYKDILPHLVAIKSIIDQHDSNDSDGNMKDDETKYLLLLQAKYELISLIRTLNEVKIVEAVKKKKGKTVEGDKKSIELTDDSLSLLNNIGIDAYTAVIIDILDCAKQIFEKLNALKSVKAIVEAEKTLGAKIMGSDAVKICRDDHEHFNGVAEKYMELEKLFITE